MGSGLSAIGGAVGGTVDAESPKEIEAPPSAVDPDAEQLVDARRATEQQREPAQRLNAGGKSNPAVSFHRLRADIMRDRDAELLLEEAGPADEGQRTRLQAAMRAKKSAALETAELEPRYRSSALTLPPSSLEPCYRSSALTLPPSSLEPSIRALANRWRFLLGGLAELSDRDGRKIFANADRVIEHVVEVAQSRGWVFSPQVRLLPDPFSGKVPAKALLLVSTIDVGGRPYRLAVGRESKRDASGEVWHFHRPYAFIDLDVANAVREHEPSIFRRLQFIASCASHDLSAHSVVDVQLPGRDESYPLLNWERTLEMNRILDPRRTRVPNLEVLAGRLHRVLWSRVLAKDGGRAQRAVLAHAKRFVGSVERLRTRMLAQGDGRADEFARYLLKVYFDKNLYFVMSPAIVRDALGVDVPPGNLQREIHASDQQLFGDEVESVGEILAQFMDAYCSLAS